MKKAIIVALLVVSMISIGCHSVPVRMGAKPGMEYEVVGEGYGKAGGFLLSDFLPLGHNDRFANAYDRACRDGGGDDLINIEIRENWFWAYFGNGYTIRIKGDAIRYK